MTVKRTTLIAVLAGLVALLAPHPGSAGYGVQPNGAVQGTPSFLVYLDAEESQPYVQVSSSPELDPSGWFTTFGASCTPTTPFPEPNKYSCQLPSYYSFTPGRTYYWVFTYWKRDDCVTYSFGTYCYLQKHVSGPFPFTVAAPPPAPVAPVLPPADPYEPVGISTKTASSAASLRSSGTWDGLASIKHTALTRVAYAVMKALGRPRTLAVACWTDDDWLSVLESEDDEPTHGDTTLRGFWKLLQPRWLHLAPGVCDDAQSLLDTGVPTGRRASALATLLHETLHAHGLRAEALTNCYAVQLVPLAGRKLGLDSRRAGYLGRLAARYVRSHAPAGYWSAASCRDGGRWDLYPGNVNLR